MTDQFILNIVTKPFKFTKKIFETRIQSQIIKYKTDRLVCQTLKNIILYSYWNRLVHTKKLKKLF